MVRADEPFESASTIKLATLVLAYQMADANTLKLDERVEITPAALRGGRDFPLAVSREPADKLRF